MFGVFAPISPPPSGECAAHGDGGCHSGVRVDAVSGGAACGRARFDAVYEKEMVHPLESVQVELCEDACCVES
jgi:hypothetical protein